MTEWIQWKKRKPEDKQKCMFFVNSDFYRLNIVTGIYHTNAPYPYIQSSIPDCGCSGIDKEYITHWAELPQSPKDES